MRRLLLVLLAVGSLVLEGLPDVLCLVGVGLVVVGVWMIYPPAAVIAAGLVLFTVGWRWAWTLERTA